MGMPWTLGMVQAGGETFEYLARARRDGKDPEWLARSGSKGE